MSIAFQATVSRSGISSNNLRADGRRPERPREVILAVVETRLERARDILRPKNRGRAGTYLASLVMWQESKKEKKQRLVCPLSMVSEGPLLLYAKIKVSFFSNPSAFKDWMLGSNHPTGIVY